QNNINALKNDGYKVVGYVRKSLGNESNETRLRLLRLMRDCLKGRSLVESILVSFSSKANKPMNKRDKPQTAVLNEMEVDGDTNDLISFIATNKKVCLVAIDHAGLTTNCENLRDLLEKNENLAIIIIDNLPFNNKVHIYE
ncbi:MAG: hypothetical protein EXX96DRAFT_481645, partial [Benjaminiella poitrasii]